MKDDKTQYDQESEHNNSIAEKLLDQLFPDIPVSYDGAYQILSFLSETKVNPLVIPRVIRGIHNLMIGTGKGQVIVHVQGETVNVSVREQDEEIRAKSD